MTLRPARSLDRTSFRERALVYVLTSWLFTDPNYVLELDPKRLRNYHVQIPDTRVVFLCGGRFNAVKKFPLNFVCAAIIVASGVLYWVFEASWAWHHLGAPVPVLFSYLWLLTLVFFCQASFRDPGTPPRNIHLPYDSDFVGKVKAPDEYFNVVSLPYHQDRTTGVTIKYCTTCHIWRPPRSSHCAQCNRCIMHHDHHCVFLNNCVGAGNYRYFLWFLACAVLTSAYLSAFSFIHCFRYRHGVVLSGTGQITTFAGSIAHNPATFLLALIGCVGGLYPCMLLALHLFLTANNYTTREYLNYVRPLYDLPEPYVNVFSAGNIFTNWWLCWVASPQMPALLHNRRPYVPGDLTKEKVAPLRWFETT